MAQRAAGGHWGGGGVAARPQRGVGGLPGGHPVPAARHAQAGGVEADHLLGGGPREGPVGQSGRASGRDGEQRAPRGGQTMAW